MKTTISLAVLVYIGLVLSTPQPVVNVQLAQQIHNATFIERTPEFTDLYMIQTPDKGRLITIYCNASYCYKRSGMTMTV